MAEEAVDGGGGCPGSAPPDATDSMPGEEAEYECKICYNYFDLERHVPKLLLCSHTFCLQCLEALHSRGGRGWRVGCPLCRHRTPVPEYRVCKLPDNTTLTESGVLPLTTREPVDTSGARTCPAASSSSSSPITTPTVPGASSAESTGSCHTCKQVAFATGCVCAIFSFVSMAVLLFLGLIFVHNFNSSASPVGPACLFVASVLALLSLILTWLLCMLKYRPETDASNFSSLTSNMM